MKEINFNNFSFIQSLKESSPFFEGLTAYEKGANDSGYGDGPDARIKFDKKYGISDFIDKNEEINFNDKAKLYRGLTTTKEFIDNLKNGDIVDMCGLSSWSVDKGVAHSFVENSLVQDGNEKVIFVDETKGKRKAMIYPFSSSERGWLGNGSINSVQAEILYSGNANFKVKNIRKNGGITYVEVEEEK